MDISFYKKRLRRTKLSHDANLFKKNIFVILGFARSGTSVISRGLQTLGVDLGQHIKTQKSHISSWNPTGFWEDEDIIFHIHKDVYKVLNHPMRSICIIESSEYQNPALNPLKQPATLILRDRFKNNNYWGFKDPNTAKILPFWQDIFKSENLQANYIIALRHPLASAQSYAKLTKMDVETGLLLWLTHLIPAIDNTMHQKRMVIDYEAMLQDPSKQLLRIQTQLSIDTTTQNIADYTENFLDKNLDHYHVDDCKTHSALKIAPLCQAVYELLLKAANDEETLDSFSFLTNWETIKKTFDEQYPIYCYIDTLLKKNKALKLANRRMSKSIVWKWFYPLQQIDDYFRDLRVKKRAKKRLLTAYE